MFKIQEQNNTSNIFQLLNPVVFVFRRLWGPDNLIIKLTWTIKETKRVLENLSFRMCDFSVICRLDLRYREWFSMDTFRKTTLSITLVGLMVSWDWFVYWWHNKNLLHHDHWPAECTQHFLITQVLQQVFILLSHEALINFFFWKPFLFYFLRLLYLSTWFLSLCLSLPSDLLSTLANLLVSFWLFL